jgi:hypothetical protein
MSNPDDDPPDATQVETELPRAAPPAGMVVQLVPRPTPDTKGPTVHATTIEILELMLAQARKGEATCIVAVTWHPGGPPQIRMSTDDKVLALGALRTMEHCVVRDWLDGGVISK